MLCVSGKTPTLRVNHKHLSWYYGIPITSHVTSQTTISIYVSPFHILRMETWDVSITQETKLQGWNAFWWHDDDALYRTVSRCDALPVFSQTVQRLYFRLATRPAECRCKDRHYVSSARNVLLQSETRSAKRIRATLVRREIKRAKKWNTAPPRPQNARVSITFRLLIHDTYILSRTVEFAYR